MTQAQAQARVLVIRHGRTAWNRERFLGRVDVPLDSVGRAQARTVADVLADDVLDRLWSSPLQRAMCTAQPLAERCGLVPRARAELSELDCGEWQGQLTSDPDAKISTRDPELAMPGGESISDAWRRIEVFLHSVALDLRGGASVVVGHYVVNQLLVAQLLGQPVDRALRSAAYRPAPGSVLELVWSAGIWRSEGFRVTALAGQR